MSNSKKNKNNNNNYYKIFKKYLIIYKTNGIKISSKESSYI